MKIITNTPLIRRNRKIGQYSTIISLAVLAGGLYLSFTQPDKIMISYGALLVGFLLSQVGMYFTNRYGRNPGTDEQLNAALKGMDDHFSLYHYVTPASHLLVGPVGVWILLPFHQKGIFTFEKGRYRLKGGSWFMKVFGQEGIGRPELEIDEQRKAVEKILDKDPTIADTAKPINAVLVMMNPNANIDLGEDAPAPGISVKKLKEFVRKKINSRTVPLDKVNAIRELLPKGE